MKTMISNLPVYLLEEILSRVPVTSIGTVRSTCKNWNVLSKDQRFANKHIEKAEASQREKNEVLVITGEKDYLTSINFYDFHNKNFYPSINRKGILVTRENSDKELYLPHHVFYCNGLLLRLCQEINHRLMVWNPYWGTRRWINCPRKCSFEMFAFGYDKSCVTHKILRLNSDDDDVYIHLNIYDLSSDSWRIVDEAFHSNMIEYTEPGVSLKGNTYWPAKDHIDLVDTFLLCFDFTRERFGPRLPLPLGFTYACNVSLSSVKEEKLAALLDPWHGFQIAVWVTNKIEPDAVSWSMFFKIETMRLNYCSLFGNFLIDEEKKTFVVFYNSDIWLKACIIDVESGDLYTGKGDLIESSDSRLSNLVSCYIPNSVKI